MSDDFDSLLLGRGVPAAKFTECGDFVEGTLTAKSTQQAAEFNFKNPGDRSKLKFFDSGDPIMELILTLQTTQRDPEQENDTGARRVYVSYSMQKALQKAVREAGITKSLPLGSRIKITYTHSVPVAGTSSERKEYSVVVVPPADTIAVGSEPTSSVNNASYTPELIALMVQNKLTLPAEMVAWAQQNNIQVP